MAKIPSKPVWQFQHSVDCTAPRQFAWSYWTNIANWNDPPASFHLDGQFEVGSRITTYLPDQTLHSVISQVIKDREAIIDLQLPDAIFSFHWKFESLSDRRSRMTQLLTLSGPNAEAFVAQARILKRSVPEGMKRLVAAIEKSSNAG